MTLKKRILMMLLVVLTVFSCVVPAYAGTSSAKAYESLVKIVRKGWEYTSSKAYTPIGKHEYKCSGGGYYYYIELTNGGSIVADDGSITYKEDIKSSQPIFQSTKFDKLTSGAKQEFLKDLLSVANAASYYEVNDISDETVTDLYNELQNYSGMGSQLMASLLAETKPDYATANRIYQPFSGIVGTILGFLSVIVMALLGVTMALDICYITIPAFQLIIGAEKDGTGGGGGATKFAAKIISTEAQKAVQVSQNDGQNGEFKSAIGVYFKYRWKGLIILGICLLYLVGGHIWSFVAWFIDLLSGFLGF